MNVAELIEYLKAQPQDMPIAYEFCSDHALLEASDITIADLCFARPDGYVHGKRPDRAFQKYLVFPGN